MVSKAQRKLMARIRENIAMARMVMNEMESKEQEGNVAAMSIKAMSLATVANRVREDCACVLHGREVMREA